ncbi:MAG: AI-2E family transporter [Proteobacteria bacterium]|nr:MAG: AI-2E family transporter [Pseudomonadota bacterium]
MPLLFRSPMSFPASRSALIIPLWILAAVALGTVMNAASVIFLWVIVSFFLFALLDPWMQRLNRRGVAPIASALMLVGLVSLALAGLGVLLYQSFPGMVSEFDVYQKTFTNLYYDTTHSLTDWLQSISKNGAPAAAPVTTKITQVEVVDHSSPLSGALANTMLHGLGSALTVATFAILSPILTFFLVAERNTLGSVAKKIFLDPAQGRQVWKKITDATGAFFLGNFVLAAVTFPIFLATFWFFGVGSFATLAAIGAVLNLVPFLGAILAAAIPALGLVAHGGQLGSAAGLIGICFAIHFAVANLVTPKILGSKLDLNATTSTIALIAWGELWGGLGLLLAIPITAVIKILFESSGSDYLRWIAMLMSEDPGSLLHGVYRGRGASAFDGQEAGPVANGRRPAVIDSEEGIVSAFSFENPNAEDDNDVPTRWTNN